MAQPGGKAKEISLGADFGDVVVKVNGATINVSAAGYIIVNSPSVVGWRVGNDISGDGRISKPKIGDTMPDSTIYAGISPDTKKPMYATPADASPKMMFNEATKYAATLDAHGHKDWRLPTRAELKVLFKNRAAIGGFDPSGFGPAGWYRSSSQIDAWSAWEQRFSDGAWFNYDKGVQSAVRCVR